LSNNELVVFKFNNSGGNKNYNEAIAFLEKIQPIRKLERRMEIFRACLDHLIDYEKVWVNINQSNFIPFTWRKIKSFEEKSYHLPEKFHPIKNDVLVVAKEIIQDLKSHRAFWTKLACKHRSSCSGKERFERILIFVEIRSWNYYLLMNEGNYEFGHRNNIIDSKFYSYWCSDIRAL